MDDEWVNKKTECPVCHRMEYFDWFLLGQYRRETCYFDYIYATWDVWRLMEY